MAYWIDHKESYVAGKQITFFMDSDSDVADLPTSTELGVEQDDSVAHQKVAKGSTALSIDSGNVYMLNSSDTWMQIGG